MARSVRLLVSVENTVEARAALAGGAGIVDAKDPRSGALGPVSLETFRRLCAAVGGRRPVTAALGDAADLDAVERLARAFAGAGAAFVKVGFGSNVDAARVRALAEAAVGGAARGRAGVVAVAYADGFGIAPAALIELAGAAGAAGVLVDTANKRGPGLADLVAPRQLTGWVRAAHRAGLFAAMAGKLTPGDLGMVRDAGADVAGVRGAACAGGRGGHVVAERVRALRALCGPPTALASVST